MDIRDLFLSYKIAIKEDKDIKPVFSFCVLPLYRQIFIVLWFLSVVISAFLYFACDIRFMALFMIPVLVYIVFIRILGNTKKNLKYMEKLYNEYDNKKMKLTVSVLKKRGIDATDRNTLGHVIDELEKAQKESYMLEHFVKYHSILIGIITFLLSSFIQKTFGDVVVTNAILYVIYAIFVFSAVSIVMYAVLTAIVYTCLYCFGPDYFVYEEFIHDLKQVRIFQNEVVKYMQEIE